MNEFIEKCRKTAFFIVSQSRQFSMKPFSDVVTAMRCLISPVWGGDINKNYAKFHELNLKFLEKNLSLPADVPSAEKISPNDYKVWILWWQGEERMPELVKAAVASTKRAAGHEVVVVTEKNVGDYVDIPDFIYDRVKAGQMLFAHLSDYIRVNLLYRYGGLWIDSTILCTGKLPEDIFNMSFFTVRSVANGNRYVAKGRWNVQVLGSNEKYNRVFFFLKSLFEEYLSKYSKMIDYLLLDYCFQFVYDHDEKSRMMFDDVPFSNPSMHLLRGMMNDVYDNKALERLSSDGTYLFKLSYKMNLLKQMDGKLTNYGYLIAPNT